MRFKKLIIVIFTCFLLLPYSVVFAYRNVEKITDLRSAFFLVNLNKGDTLIVTVDSLEGGNYALFLFDKRPEETHVNFDGTLDPAIYSESIQHSQGKKPILKYTAEENKIYYIQLILLSGGPDTYILESNKELSRYYLPQLAGYNIEILIISTLLIASIIFIMNRKRFIKREI